MRTQVADIRVGVVTVHDGEGDFQCLDGRRDACLFWRQGTWVEDDKTGHWTVDPEDVQIAQYIVQCVNSHEALVQAGIAVLACVVWDDTKDKALYELDGDTVRQLREALKRSEA